MKSSFYGALALSMIISMLFFNSCQKKEEDTDPCEGIVCQNDGICKDGKCDCKEGFEGNRCQDQITPSKIIISRIVVTRFPALDNGINWDVLDGPDIFWAISDGTNTVSSQIYYEDADPSLDYTFELNPTVDLSNATIQYEIGLFDWDDGITDPDFMGSIIFAPYNSTGGFPTKLTVDAGGDVAFELYVSYVW